MSKLIVGRIGSYLKTGLSAGGSEVFLFVALFEFFPLRLVLEFAELVDMLCR